MMALLAVRWSVLLTCFVTFLFTAAVFSNARGSAGSHLGHHLFRRNELNFTNPRNSTLPSNNSTLPGNNSTLPSNNSTDLTNSTTSSNTTYPACEFSPEIFRTTLATQCQTQIEAIQKCPTSALSNRERRELAKSLSVCAVSVYRDVNTCEVYTIPAFGLPPFESDDRLGEMGKYLNPFSDRILGKRSGGAPAACKNPDIFPIFEQAIRPFKNDTDGRWLGVEKTPFQYLRCALQVPDHAVESCVTSSIRKLQYLPDRLIIYGGQKSCSTRVQMMIMTIMMMAMEAMHVAAEILYTRHKRKTDPDYGRSFSWVGLFRAVILGLGTPLICALIIRTQFPENSLAAALGLYLLTPRAAPIIAFLSGIFLSKGFGTQTLLVDLVSGGGALVLYDLPLKFWNGPMATLDPPASAPSTTFLYLGLYLSTVPAGIVFFIYQIILIIAVALFIWSIFAKSKGLAKTAGVLVGLWLAMWIWIFSFAIFAIYEVVWLAFYKKKGGKFPILENLRTWFSRVGSPLGFFLKRYGYWTWVIISFITAVGRWMFLNDLLRLTGNSFCPDSLKGATAASILVTWSAIVANVLLKLNGLAL